MERIKSIDEEKVAIEESPTDKQELSIESVLSKKDEKLEQQSTLEYKIEKGVISIDGSMPLLEDSDPLKKSMMSMCSVVHCERGIIFSPDIKTPDWKDMAKEVIDLFQRENLSYATLLIDKESKITIGGEFINRTSKDRLSSLLNKYNQYSVNDTTTLKELKVKEEERVVEQSISEINSTVEDSRDAVEIAQDEITEILKSKNINFVRNRARITKKGIETLNEIIVILKKVPDVKIEVRGYTDASGKRAINKWISEERAKSVRNYLGSSGINPVNIVAKGFGEEDLLYEDKPYSKLNRRVEIGIRR
jgi:outer membrane protein OmpA-like peptidoglycan-associated protein